MIASQTSLLVLRKKFGADGLHCSPSESSSSAIPIVADRSLGSRVIAKRSRRSSHSCIAFARQSCWSTARPIGSQCGQRAAPLRFRSCPARLSGPLLEHCHGYPWPTWAKMALISALVSLLNSTRGKRTRGEMMLNRLSAYLTGTGLLSRDSAAVSLRRSLPTVGLERFCPAPMPSAWHGKGRALHSR
jgi:hypothetical protein